MVNFLAKGHMELGLSQIFWRQRSKQALNLGQRGSQEGEARQHPGTLNVPL